MSAVEVLTFGNCGRIGSGTGTARGIYQLLFLRQSSPRMANSASRALCQSGRREAKVPRPAGPVSVRTSDIRTRQRGLKTSLWHLVSLATSSRYTYVVGYLQWITDKTRELDGMAGVNFVLGPKESYFFNCPRLWAR